MITIDKLKKEILVRKRKFKIAKVNYTCCIVQEVIIVPQSKEGLVKTFRLTNTRKVEMLHNVDLIVRLNIRNYILKRVFIYPAADVSIMYKRDFSKMGLLPSMLNPPMSSLKSSDTTQQIPW